MGSVELRLSRDLVQPSQDQARPASRFSMLSPKVCAEAACLGLGTRLLVHLTFTGQQGDRSSFKACVRKDVAHSPKLQS